MSKILKIVAVVASIAASAVTFGASLGISAALLSSVALGAGLGASLLAPRQKAPTNSEENRNRLRANIDPLTPRKTVIGNTAMATDIRDEEFTDNQGFLHRFIVAAGHKVQSFDEIWFDDKRVWTSSGGVEGEAVGYLTVSTRTEGTAANAINISSRMGSSRRYTGLAYVYLRYAISDEESPYAQSITSRITIRGKGAALYDPREDSTVAGGSGTHRADDQSTWAWDADASRNPALALLFYLLGYKINGLLALGKGIPPERIDLESFAVAANICDETVSTISGSEPRYRCDGLWSEGDNPGTVIDMLKACMNADLDDVGGKLRLSIYGNDLATPVADFDDNDIIDEFSWQPLPALDDTFNVVRGLYTDPSNNSLYQPVDYPEQRVDSPDGIERIEILNLPMVQSSTQAQRLAALRLNRQIYGGGTFQAEFQATAWKVTKGSVIRLSFQQTGFNEKLFRVAEMEINRSGIVPLTLREESSSIYTAPTLRDSLAPIASTPYDPTLDPFRLTTVQILISTSSQTGLSITATDTSITIGNHTRVYTDKFVSVTGATLTVEDDGTTAIAAETRYYLYYDDPTRAGGAVSWKATQDFDTAQTTATNPGRHFAGFITTDVVGGSGTTGGGALPPGTGGVDPGGNAT